MRLTLTMTTAALGSFLFGLAYLLIPERLLSLYGIVLDPSAQWTARYLGAIMLGLGAVNWLGRKVRSGAALRAIITGTFIATTLGLIVSIFEVLNSSGNMLVWSSVVIWLLLSIGYGDFIFRTPPPE